MLYFLQNVDYITYERKLKLLLPSGQQNFLHLFSGHGISYPLVVHWTGINREISHASAILLVIPLLLCLH